MDATASPSPKPYGIDIRMRMLMPAFFAQPAKDAELALAVRLLGHRTAIDLELLDSLVGQPMRYAALQDLLKGRNDTVLNRALSRLTREGLVQQRLDVRHRHRVYGLTALGKLVLYRVQQMRPVQQSIDAYRRGLAAQAA